MSRVARVLAAGLLVAGLMDVAPVFAHPILVSSIPDNGAVISRLPPRLVLRFNNRVEKALCRIALVDAGGRSTPLSVATGEGDEAALIAPMPAVPPGSYRVDWRVLSADGHFVSGSLSFRFAKR